MILPITLFCTAMVLFSIFFYQAINGIVKANNIQQKIKTF